MIERNKSKLLEQRYEFSLGALLSEAREGLKWTDGKAMKNEMDKQVKVLSEIEYSIELISYWNFWVRRIVHQERMTQRWVKDRRLQVVISFMIWEICDGKDCISGQTNGQIHSFTELVGAALNFHRTGRFVMSDQPFF